MELPASYLPDSPMEGDDTPYPCKGCGEILEEGKAFELAGHRWHIDCFRCNTCGTLLDSDANLLLLGDGSLICNNCTYSCSACGNKIEDLAILTGDQAYCASCFRCRNCKRKIENLRYARTTQGMFCMECHDALMARRRKKSSKGQSRSNKAANGTMLLDKSLPSLPPSAVPSSVLSPDRDAMSDAYSDTTPAELPASSPNPPSSNLNVPPNVQRGRNNSYSQQTQELEDTDNGFFIPMTLDPNPAPGPPPSSRAQHHELDAEQLKPRRTESDQDYFSSRKNPRRALQDSRSNSASRVPSANASRSRSPAVRSRDKEAEADPGEGARKRKPSVANGQSAESTPRSKREESDPSKFQLQEAPKRKKSVSSKRNSKGEVVSPTLDTSGLDNKSTSAPASAHVPLREQHVSISTAESPRTSLGPPHTASPRITQDRRDDENGPSESSKTVTPEPPILPKRGDSLQKHMHSASGIARKEVGGMKSTSTALRDELSSREAASPINSRRSAEQQTSVNGGKVISRPMESPISKSSLDYPPRSKDRPAPGGNNDSFSSPRAPPQPPEGQVKHKNKASVSSIRSDSANPADAFASPGLPRHQADNGELRLTGDLDRIMGGEDGNSFLKRVSNSVRHARSHSDRGSRGSRDQSLKWPRTPLNGTAGGTLPEDLSSPLMSSPDARDESNWYKAELRKEQAKATDLEKKIEELEGAIEGKSTIKQMSKELREKRSTMVVLDTQKEIVFRELEVLTEHITAAKKSNQPLDLSSLSNGMVREFADNLEKLKDTFTPQIEELMEKKVTLSEDVAKLNQQRDKAMQEFEQLSMKNAQLAELNNNLVHQIQELHKAGVGPDQAGKPATGLGIYTHHHKEKSSASIDSRDMRPSIAESGMTGSTLNQEHDPESGAQILTAPRVVNIAKGQPKKTFNWKKGGNAAKGVTKGLKAAFSSGVDSRMQREGSTPGSLEGTPYQQMAQNGELPTTTLPGRMQSADPSRQGFGFFSQQKKPMTGPGKAMNGSFPQEEVQHPSKLFGAELESRAEYERTSIPGIVTRCIQEVELRGMDLEGIYRKSGGAAQIQVIRDGFIQSNDFDISDPDLDINAVTSTLKQYFRKLPTPLITFPVYDELLESTTSPDTPERIALMRSAVNNLPTRHRDCLEFLVFHLARVVERERENLMTSLNCAVVFAPTIMRPESIAREMSDTAAKNVAVQFLIDNCHAVFLGGNGVV